MWVIQPFEHRLRSRKEGKNKRSNTFRGLISTPFARHRSSRLKSSGETTGGVSCGASTAPRIR